MVDTSALVYATLRLVTPIKRKNSVDIEVERFNQVVISIELY